MTIEAMAQDLIVLDADGVLIDYHEGYAQAWERAFGYRPSVRNIEGYHPMDYWDVPTLTRSEVDHFANKGFCDAAWRSMPAIPGALKACERLQNAGYRLAVVTALHPQHGEARRQNLVNLGFKFEAVHAVGHATLGNPKRSTITKLAPRAFVDDYLGYLQHLPATTWRALIAGRIHNNPNSDPALKRPDSVHSSLAEFAEWWITNSVL